MTNNEKLLVQSFLTEKQSENNKIRTMTSLSNVRDPSSTVHHFRDVTGSVCLCLSAEHLKNAPDNLFHILANLINSILQTGNVPPQLKQYILTPVLKKKKDATLLTNYRRKRSYVSLAKFKKEFYRSEEKPKWKPSSQKCREDLRTTRRP